MCVCVFFFLDKYNLVKFFIILGLFIYYFILRWPILWLTASLAEIDRALFDFAER
jgi:hypothetical protein